MAQRNSLAFSLHACCGVLASYGAGENMTISILMDLKNAGKIQNGYIRQGDLNAAIKAAGLSLAA